MNYNSKTFIHQFSLNDLPKFIRPNDNYMTIKITIAISINNYEKLFVSQKRCKF